MLCAHQSFRQITWGIKRSGKIREIHDVEKEKLKEEAQQKAEQSFLDKIPKRTVKKSTSYTRTKKPAKGPQVGQGNVVAIYEG